MKQPILTLICAALISVSAVAQSDLDNLIKGSTEDANYLVKGYITPALNTVGYGLNQGWYNTAKPHKVLGFDLTITAAAISIPSADLSYRVENSKLSTIDLVTPTPTGGGANVPTIFGSDVAPTYRFRAGGSTFQGAPGLNLDIPVAGTAVPIPMVQLGIGLPKGTDVKLRFFPNTGLGAGGRDGSIDFLWRLGVQHHWSDLNVKGTFDLDGNSATTVDRKDNPISISNSTSSASFTAGLRLKLAIFTFHGDYTFQKYNALTLGFGFNVR